MSIRAFIKKVIYIVSGLTPVLILIVSSLLSCLICSHTTDYKLDYIACHINDIRKQAIGDEGFESSIFNVGSQFKNNYNDLLNNFSSSSFTKSTRIVASDTLNYLDYELNLITQDTFSIQKSKAPEGGYRLDRESYNTYFSDEILGDRQYMSIRYNCDSFIFVSDIFADKLIAYYGIDGDAPYETLIKKEEYCVLPLSSGNKTIKFCINNIVFSSIRGGVRAKEVYGDFAIFYRGGKASAIETSFEVDLKDNPYCIKQVFKSTNLLGYNCDNSTFKIITKEKDSKSYIYNEYLTNLYCSAWASNDVVLYVSLFIFAFFSVVAFCFSLGFKRCKNRISFISCCVLFLSFGILSVFIDVYPLFSLLPTILIVVLVLAYLQEIKSAFKKFFIR